MTATPQKNYSILVVDDEPKTLNTFQLHFKKQFHILTASSGEKALEILKTQKEPEIAIVIADQRMNGMTGVELLTQIKQSFPQTIRILFTAYSDTEVLGSSINQAGVFKYIYKPYQAQEAQEILKESLQKYIQEKEKNTQLENITQLIQEKTSHAMENYTAWMAHHINNAMQSVYTFTQLAVSRFNKDASEIELSETALECIKRIKAITTNLKTIYRDSLQDFKKVELNTLLNFENEPLKKALLEKGITLKKETEGGQTKILASPTALQETLRKLVTNSIEASQTGKTIQIHVKPEEKNKLPGISFTIQDEGTGITEEMQKYLFFPLINLSKDNERLAGLGLPYAQGMIARHGGEIEIKSKPNKGTEVHFWIPILEQRILETDCLSYLPD